jgi:hypothetical protein
VHLVTAGTPETLETLAAAVFTYTVYSVHALSARFSRCQKVSLKRLAGTPETLETLAAAGTGAFSNSRDSRKVRNTSSKWYAITAVGTAATAEFLATAERAVSRQQHKRELEYQGMSTTSRRTPELVETLFFLEEC